MRPRAIALLSLCLAAGAHAEDAAPAAQPATAAATTESPAPAAAPASEPAPAPAPQPPAPIGIADFAGHPLATLPVLSPDGTQVAIVYRDDDTRAVAVRPLASDDSSAARVIGALRYRPLWMRWTKGDRILVSIERFQPRTLLKVPERDPEPPLPIYNRRGQIVGYHIPPQPPPKEIPAGRVTHIYSFDATRERRRHLGRDWEIPARIQDNVLHWLDADPKRVLISLDESERFVSRRIEASTVQTMTVNTGRLRTVVAPNRKVQRWFANHAGEVQLGESDTNDGSTVLYRREGRRLKEVSTFIPPLETTARFAAHSYDPDLIYAWAPINGRQALILLRLSDGIAEEVFAHPRVDVTGPLIFDEAQKKLVAVGYVDDTPELHALDEKLAAELERMKRALPGLTLEVVSESADKKLALVRASSDTRAPAFYLFDRAKSELRLEFEERGRLENEKLAPMESTRYFARDGREIPAYLTRPRGGTKPAPAIVLVHDGPDQRVHRRFDPLVQWLARSGFAVLEPNYRGSAGYGLEHRSVGFGEWGRAMQEDLDDAAKWLASEGIADPARIGIYGRGYGGYAALMGVSRAGALFRAAASHGGPTDLVELLEEDDRERIEPDWSKRIMGARKIKDAQLREVSPIQYAAAVTSPVLLLHSEYDERVPLSHAERYAEAARKAGRAVELVEFEGEVHELAHEKNRLLWFEKLTAFFQTALAPPAQTPAPAAAQETSQ
jgi:dipeptidyl aminopeptidase/acylaminoacyl peptidase